MGQQVKTVQGWEKQSKARKKICSQSAATVKAKETQGDDDLRTSSRSRRASAHSQTVRNVREERKRGWRSCKGVMK